MVIFTAVAMMFMKETLRADCIDDNHLWIISLMLHAMHAAVATSIKFKCQNRYHRNNTIHSVQIIYIHSVHLHACSVAGSRAAHMKPLLGQLCFIMNQLLHHCIQRQPAIIIHEGVMAHQAALVIGHALNQPL
jgi:hypothetical protein